MPNIPRAHSLVVEATKRGEPGKKKKKANFVSKFPKNVISEKKINAIHKKCS